jgi:ParB-like chromosome segregation protein Spo0J
MLSPAGEEDADDRLIVEGEGTETGMFEVPAGGRRFRALELLVKQMRMAKTALVPCIVKGADDAISAEEDTLAENAHRASRCIRWTSCACSRLCAART